MVENAFLLSDVVWITNKSKYAINVDEMVPKVVWFTDAKTNDHVLLSKLELSPDKDLIARLIFALLPHEPPYTLSVSTERIGSSEKQI